MLEQKRDGGERAEQRAQGGGQTRPPDSAQLVALQRALDVQQPAIRGTLLRHSTRLTHTLLHFSSPLQVLRAALSSRRTSHVPECYSTVYVRTVEYRHSTTKL